MPSSVFVFSKQYFKGFVLGSLLCLQSLSGCSPNSNGFGLGQSDNTSAPIQLGAPQSAQGSQDQSTSAQIKTDLVKRAIENYKINRGEKSGSYQHVLTDLNSDGQAELLVYFTGENWCARTGCTLVILSSDKINYKEVSTIRRVKRPVVVGTSVSNGWHDIYVRTGLGTGLSALQVGLKFSGSGYPGNATLVAPLPRDAKVDGKTVIDLPPPGAVSKNTQ